ncbi:MAG: response regulator [Planctomycetes bacterium]|nr:response regulator [Planctomycetota bacterium]
MKKTILVVDDAQIARLIAIKALINLNGDFIILEAADGLEALKLFTEKNIDLLITDWNMPNMDGIELIKAIRDTGKGQKIPILISTTNQSLTHIKTALEAGATTYIKKPVNDQQMKEKIERIFSF